jgi:hypothetical protein
MGSARQARKQAYWALLSGATGHAYGSPLWAFPPDWKRYLHLPGAGSLKHFHTLFSSVPWYRLVPDIMSTLVKDGAGAYAGNDYATAAITADKRLALIYIPSGRTLHLDLTQLAGKTVKATWFNPRSGERWVIKPPAHRPDAPFETPDADDWVLLLEAG